jgi:phage repressor protein C with HTH and peptisase S24 domain
MRLALIRKELALNQAEMAQKLGVSANVYNRYENGKLALPHKHFFTFEEIFNVNAKWLREGEGEMFIGGAAPEGLKIKEATERAPKQRTEPSTTAELLPGAEKLLKMRLLPIYEVNVEAGDRSYHDDVARLQQWEAFPFYGEMEADCVFTVRGDSMEPRFYSGERLICKEVKDWRFIGNNSREAYVIHFGNMCWVKFVRQNHQDPQNGFMELTSLNGAYTPIKVPLSEIRHVWKILSTIF